ncbi:MAG: hypothetical protein LN561_06300 [Rickettsia endosymbiont of Labidopullus appendiculatus]|nr:hypothetical protein [Rickettsia endosymbiont of Labidopullus appendiculatus]
MILTPIFKNYIECVRIPNVGVVFLSERFTNIVPNKLYIEVCDMINGVNSSDYIIKQLSDKHRIGEIHFILSELERKNYIQENTKTDLLISCFDQQINDFFKSDVSMLSEINLITLVTLMIRYIKIY